MLDVDTFLTALYVMVDDFCHSQPPKKRPGPKASLSDSEVVTLAIFARWGRFCGERDFYRYARKHLHDAFPPCPIARSSIGWCARAWVASRRLPCTWDSCQMPEQMPEASPATRLWTPRPCPFATRSAEARDGLLATRRSGGPIAWGGTKAFA
jgi:hypothetical protein